MALAFATALSWRPLLPRPSCHAVAVNSARIGAMSASRRGTSPGTRWTSSSCCGNGLGNFILRDSFSSPFGDIRVKFSSSNLERRGRRSGNGSPVTTRAGMRLDPGGGGSNDGGIGRVIVNFALAGGFTYLAITGKLGWIFDTLVSLWLLAVLVPIISFVAFLWFAEREIVKVDDDKQFVRDEPRFSDEETGGFRNAFGGFGRDSSSKTEDPGGVIVDVEAEVVDRD